MLRLVRRQFEGGVYRDRHVRAYTASINKAICMHVKCACAYRYCYRPLTMRRDFEGGVYWDESADRCDDISSRRAAGFRGAARFRGNTVLNNGDRNCILTATLMDTRTRPKGSEVCRCELETIILHNDVLFVMIADYGVPLLGRSFNLTYNKDQWLWFCVMGLRLKHSAKGKEVGLLI